MGIKSLKDALTVASFAGLDLVLMNSNATPAVGKIMDYNKYRYEKQRKQKEALKKQKETNKELKEYRFGVTIDTHDFETKVKNAKDYLSKGHKIKGMLRFKGRQIAHPEIGREILAKFSDSLSEVGTVETPIKQDGKVMTVIIAPNK